MRRLACPIREASEGSSTKRRIAAASAAGSRSRHDEAVDTIDRRLPASRDAGGDHRAADGERLDDRARQPLAIVRRQHEGGAGTQERPNVLGVTQIVDHVFGPPGGDIVARQGAGIAVQRPQQLKPALWRVPLEDFRGFDEVEYALFTQQTGDQQECWVSRRLRRERELIEIDPGAVNLDDALIRSNQPCRADELLVVVVEHEHAGAAPETYT